MTTALLAETNVVSYLFSGHTLALRYEPLIEGRRIVVSFMTVAEMYDGAVRARWGPERLARLERLLRERVQIVRAKKPVCMQWARIRYERRARPISGEDAWIAACARAERVPLVTHDARDFEGIDGLAVLTAA